LHLVPVHWLVEKGQRSLFSLIDTSQPLLTLLRSHLPFAFYCSFSCLLSTSRINLATPLKFIYFSCLIRVNEIVGKVLWTHAKTSFCADHRHFFVPWWKPCQLILSKNWILFFVSVSVRLDDQNSVVSGKAPLTKVWETVLSLSAALCSQHTPLPHWETLRSSCSCLLLWLFIDFFFCNHSQETILDISFYSVAYLPPGPPVCLTK
jgi:hypothetical protein